jgi:hypothetical protein
MLPADFETDTRMKTNLVTCDDDPRYTPFSVDPKEVHGEDSNIIVAMTLK